jgi:hypothetical protein
MEIELLQSLLGDLVVLIATGSLSIIHVNLVPVKYRLKYLYVVNGPSAIDDHQEVVNKDRESELDILLLEYELLRELRTHWFDVAHENAFDFSPQVCDLYLIGILIRLVLILALCLPLAAFLFRLFITAIRLKVLVPEEFNLGDDNT